MFNLTASNVMNGIMDIYFRDPTNGWVVGMNTNQYAAPPYYGCIARTTNAGASWQTQVTTTISNCYFWKMSWPSTNIGYVSLQQNGSYSNLVFYKTVDGGNTWVSNGIPETSVGLYTNGYNFYLQGLGFVSTNEGWIGGASGLPSAHIDFSFLHTTNGGATWTQAGFNDTFFINRIRFMNSTLGFASGGNLYLYSAPLVITNQPASQTVVGPTNVTFTVTASGTAPYYYQWQLNGTNISGSTRANVEPAQAWCARTMAFIPCSSPTPIPESKAAMPFSPSFWPNALGNHSSCRAIKYSFSLPTRTEARCSRQTISPRLRSRASTNLINWFTITNALSLSNGSAVLVDTITNAPRKFYQVLEQ